MVARLSGCLEQWSLPRSPTLQNRCTIERTMFVCLAMAETARRMTDSAEASLRANKKRPHALYARHSRRANETEYEENTGKEASISEMQVKIK